MQKIVIKNFGPIQFAEIEIRPFTVLLGEQATGKSTVAELVQFFNSLAGRDWLLKFLSKGEKVLLDSKEVESIMLDAIKEKYQLYYGNNFTSEGMVLKYFFNTTQDKYLELKKKDGELSVSFSHSFGISEFCLQVSLIFKEKDHFNTQYKRLRTLLNDFASSNWSEDFLNPTFFIAGRSITTSYPETFKSFFLEHYREASFKSSHFVLTSLFIQHSSLLIDVINQNGGSFATLFSKENIFLKDDFLRRVEFILKGKYYSSGTAESIEIVGKLKAVLLSQASSGQQESIRILQHLALLYASNIKSFLMIEEPEAHLFPSAQNALTELMVMTHNRTGSHFFLTTHSPYFLSSFNNLLYAAKAAGDNLPEGETPNPEHIKQVEALGFPKHLRLQAKDFAAYQLKNGIAESIFNPDYAVTDIDGLDAVSFEIASKFEALVEIVKEAEAYEAA
ncbi:MAG: AAA family ATPase [Saprospiraceae bacterium]